MKKETEKLLADVDRDLALLESLHNSLYSKKLTEMSQEEINGFLKNIDTDIELLEKMNMENMTMEELLKKI